jgi:hypothetical protein
MINTKDIEDKSPLRVTSTLPTVLRAPALVAGVAATLFLAFTLIGAVLRPPSGSTLDDVNGSAVTERTAAIATAPPAPTISSATRRRIFNTIDALNEAEIDAYRTLDVSPLECCVRGPLLDSYRDRIADSIARGVVTIEDLRSIDRVGDLSFAADGTIHQRTTEYWVVDYYDGVDGAWLDGRSDIISQTYVFQYLDGDWWLTNSIDIETQ